MYRWTSLVLSAQFTSCYLDFNDSPSRWLYFLIVKNLMKRCIARYWFFWLFYGSHKCVFNNLNITSTNTWLFNSQSQFTLPTITFANRVDSIRDRLIPVIRSDTKNLFLALNTTHAEPQVFNVNIPTQPTGRTRVLKITGIIDLLNINKTFCI